MGYLRHGYYRTLGRREVSAPDLGPLEDFKRLIFVCEGNICRSPLAEVAARAHGVSAQSFGIKTRGGKPAHSLMIDAAKARGLDLTSHLSRSMDSYQPCSSDLVLCMEPAHIKALAQKWRGEMIIALLGSWARPERPYIHDPYSCTSGYFKTSTTIIIDAVERLLAEREASAGRVA
jgi:protein-tyrosine phosphatase